MLSLHTGYDTGYLTDAVGTGADYYPGAEGEPPGYWQGAGAGRSALPGEVDARGDAAAVPRGHRPGRPGPRPAAAEGELPGGRRLAVQADRGRGGPRQVPSGAGSSRRRRSARSGCRLRSAYRTVVPFYDYTYSAPKSVSVLWASLLAASAEAEAEGREADAERFAERAAQVRGAVKRANDRMIAVAERELAYVRTGHHSETSGEWRDAEGFIVASFQQHDSRDGLTCSSTCTTRSPTGRSGRTERTSTWRALHGHPLFRNKLRHRDAGRPVPRPGAGAASACSACSARTGRRSRSAGSAMRPSTSSAPGARNCGTGRASSRRSTSASTATLRASGPGGRSSSGPRLETRDSKDHNPPPAGQQVAAWARKAERSGIGALAALHEAAAALRGGARAERAAERSGAGADHPQGRRRGAAGERHVGPVAADFRARPGRFRPLPADVDPEEYLNGLADEAAVGPGRGRERAAGRPGAGRHRRLPAAVPQGRDEHLPAAGRGAVLHRRAPGP